MKDYVKAEINIEKKSIDVDINAPSKEAAMLMAIEIALETIDNRADLNQFITMLRKYNKIRKGDNNENKEAN